MQWWGSFGWFSSSVTSKESLVLYFSLPCHSLGDHKIICGRPRGYRYTRKHSEGEEKERVFSKKKKKRKSLFLWLSVGSKYFLLACWSPFLGSENMDLRISPKLVTYEEVRISMLGDGSPLESSVWAVAVITLVMLPLSSSSSPSSPLFYKQEVEDRNV